MVEVSPIIRSSGDWVVFGGLVSPNSNSRDYLSAFYTALLTDHGSTATPFDMFAIHPYPSEEYVDANGKRLLDPYLYLNKESSTVLKKFHIVLQGDNALGRNDSNKDIWVTEFGWNSALGSEADQQNLCPAAEELWVNDGQQELYLASGLDILFKETAWPGENRQSVTKAFWFQYRDTGLSLNRVRECVVWPEEGPISWYNTYFYLFLYGPSPEEEVIVPWSYGLVDNIVLNETTGEIYVLENGATLIRWHGDQIEHFPLRREYDIGPMISLGLDPTRDMLYAGILQSPYAIAWRKNQAPLLLRVVAGSQAIVYDQTHDYIYTADYNGPSMSVIRGTTVLATLNTGGHGPWDVGVDEERGYIYVSNADSHNIAVFGFDQEVDKRSFWKTFLPWLGK